MKKNLYTVEEQFYYLVMKQKKLKTIYNKLLKPVRYNYIEEIKKEYENKIKNTLYSLENLEQIKELDETQIISIKIKQGYIYDYMIIKNKDNYSLNQINTNYKIKDINSIYEEIKEYIVEVEAYLNPNKEIHTIIEKTSVLNYQINHKKNKIYYEELVLNINENGESFLKEEIDLRIEKELNIVEHRIKRELDKKNITLYELQYADSIFRVLNNELEIEINKIQDFLINLEPLDLMQFELIDLHKNLKEKTLKNEIAKEPKMNDFMKRIVNETLTVKKILESNNKKLIKLIEPLIEKNTSVFTLKFSNIETLKKHIETSINKLNSLTINLKKEYDDIKKKSSKLELLDYNSFCNEFEDFVENTEKNKFSFER